MSMSISISKEGCFMKYESTKSKGYVCMSECIGLSESGNSIERITGGG
jgi:hypothetical protein